MGWSKDINGKKHEFYKCCACGRLVTLWQIVFGVHQCPRCGGLKVKTPAVPTFFDKVFLFFNHKY